MRELKREGKLKEEKLKKLVLPYVGVDVEKCLSLRYEHGLYVQCNRERVGERNCDRCEKEKVRGINNGDVESREKVGLMDYIDPKGRRVVHYSKVMKKLNIKKEDVLEECKRLGIELDPIHLEEVKSKRGRPKKEVIVNDTDSEGEKRKRGRPRKEKKEEKINGSNLIEMLVSEREDNKVEENNEIESDDDEDATEVCEFMYNGKKYLKSDNDILYDFESFNPETGDGEIVGKWIEQYNTIEEYDE